MESRHEIDAAPLIESFEAVDALGSRIQVVSENYAKMVTEVITSVSFSVSVDLIGAPRNVVLLTGMPTYLSAKAYYKEDSG